MDTTCHGLGVRQFSQRQAPAAASSATVTTSSSTNTSVVGASTESPVWSCGSGALKELRLHEAENKVKSLEKDNAKLKEHEEFYITRGDEWKNRALKYEKILNENGISVPSRNDKVNKASSAPSVENKENTDTSRNQSSRREVAKENSVAPGSPTEDIQLNLFKRQEPGRTDQDQECKTQ